MRLGRSGVPCYQTKEQRERAARDDSSESDIAMLDYTDPRRLYHDDIYGITRDADQLGKLSAPSRLRLVAAGSVEEIPAETIMLEEGAEIREVHLIRRGMVTVSLHQSLDPALWLYNAGPGTLVGGYALLDPPISPVTIRAMTDTETLVIPRSALLEVIEAEPLVGFQVLQKVASRLALITRATLREISQEYPGPSCN